MSGMLPRINKAALRRTGILFSVLLCILFLGSPSFSQEPICSWGKPITNEKTSHKLTRILASDNTGYYALREFVAGFDSYQWLEKYRKDFTLE